MPVTKQPNAQPDEDSCCRGHRLNFIPHQPVEVPAARMPDEDGQIIFSFTADCRRHDCAHRRRCKAVHDRGTFAPTVRLVLNGPGFATRSDCMDYARSKA